MMNKTPNLGRLERVDLREVWDTEAGSFTPWLAREDNLELLGKTIGVELELEATEKNVGPFRADILCKDTATNNWVLVENQLGRTDHTHLGQLLTYAAGLDAATIVWIAQPFTDEHRGTLDWLNEITDDKFNFFGLEVEVWRIGNSEPAPKFNIVSKPNDWTTTVSKAARSLSEGELSETRRLQLEYWTELHKRLREGDSPVNPTKPYPQHWMQVSIGRTGFLMSATFNAWESRIGVEIYIQNEQAQAFFDLLYREKEDIEAEIGQTLDWQELPGRKGSRIVIYRENCHLKDEDSWDRFLAWMIQNLDLFDHVFRLRIKGLNADDWIPHEEAGAE